MDPAQTDLAQRHPARSVCWPGAQMGPGHCWLRRTRGGGLRAPHFPRGDTRSHGKGAWAGSTQHSAFAGLAGLQGVARGLHPDHGGTHSGAGDGSWTHTGSADAPLPHPQGAKRPLRPPSLGPRWALLAGELLPGGSGRLSAVTQGTHAQRQGRASGPSLHPLPPTARDRKPAGRGAGTRRRCARGLPTPAPTEACRLHRRPGRGVCSRRQGHPGSTRGRCAGGASQVAQASPWRRRRRAHPCPRAGPATHAGPGRAV